MLSADDPRWNLLRGGYKIPFDPRPLISKLTDQQPVEETWSELWNELYHQGDVGDASYAAVPLIVEAHPKMLAPEWNIFAIVATIELARTENKNPEIPAWLSDD